MRLIDGDKLIEDYAHYRIDHSYDAYDLEDMVNEQPTIDVLDKIRAEIEALDEGISNYHNDRPWIFKDEALDIIDKYADGRE